MAEKLLIPEGGGGGGMCNTFNSETSYTALRVQGFHIFSVWSTLTLNQ